MRSDNLALRAFRDLVTEVLGLEFRGEKSAELESALRVTQREAGVPDLAALFDRLETASPMGDLWRPLRERLTVGESYFFRDPNQLDVIRREVLGVWAATTPPRALRFWSAGCSTGEEAYTLAMIAQDLLPSATGWQVDVLGTDLNDAALERARSGRYRPWSFRGMDPACRERWFTPCRDEWTVSAAVRGNVRFVHHNLAQDSFEPLAVGDGFDLILCRNVFIYFTRPVVASVVRHLAAVLSPQGVMVFGHNELTGDVPPGFIVEYYADSTLVRRAAAPARPALRRAPPAACTMPTASTVPTPAQPSATRATTTSPRDDGRDLATARLALATGDYRAAFRHASSFLERHPRDEVASRIAIQVLASQGRGEEAHALLVKHLHFHPSSIGLHYLRSLLAAEQGDEHVVAEALDHVLRLAPDHIAARMDRARIHEARGRVRQALDDLMHASVVAEAIDPAVPVEGLEPFTAGEVLLQCVNLTAQLESRVSGGVV